MAETRIRVTNFERFSIFGKKIVHSHFLHFAWPASLIGARRNSHVVGRERLTETDTRRVFRGQGAFFGFDARDWSLGALPHSNPVGT